MLVNVPGYKWAGPFELYLTQIAYLRIVAGVGSFGAAPARSHVTVKYSFAVHTTQTSKQCERTGDQRFLVELDAF